MSATAADIAEADLAGLAGGIAEAHGAQVDREDVGAGISLRGFDGMLAGAAAGDQDIHGILAERLEAGEGEFLAEQRIERGRRGRDAHRGPARIGIFFVLPFHCDGDAVVDPGQMRQRRRQFALGAAFYDLLFHHGRDRRRPGAIGEPGGTAHGLQREIGGYRGNPRRRYILSTADRSAELFAEGARTVLFFGRGDPDMFVDEALLRKRAPKRQHGVGDRRRRPILRGKAEEPATQRRQHPLHVAVAHRRRPQQFAQQLVIRDVQKSLGAAQLFDSRHSRPMRRRPRGRCRDALVGLDDAQGSGCQLRRTPPGFGQRPPDPFRKARVVGRPCRSGAAREQIFGLRGFFDGECA
jgi:hypothetical protein